MSTIIKLSDEQKNILIKTYQSRLSELEKERAEILALLQQIQSSTQEQLTSDESSAIINSTASRESYKERWNWTQKVKFVLKQVGHCLTTRDILDYIMELEPTLENANSAINSVSGTISGKALKGIVFKRYQPYEGSENYVGLLEWWENEYDNEPMEQYQADA